MSAFRVQNFLYHYGFSISTYAIENLLTGYGPNTNSNERMYLHKQGYPATEANPGPASFAVIIWSACNSIALLARNWGSQDLAAFLNRLWNPCNLDVQNGK